jgi:hypothetical protein
MTMWDLECHPHDSEYRKAVDTIAILNGPVADIELTFTDLDLGQGVFRGLSENQRNTLSGRIRRCLREFFKDILDQKSQAFHYKALASRVQAGDVVVTFNYETSLENELIRANKFRVRNGYGFEADWDEPDPDVKVLKLHGSINWLGVLFGITSSGLVWSRIGDAYQWLEWRRSRRNPDGSAGRIISKDSE